MLSTGFSVPYNIEHKSGTVSVDVADELALLAQFNFALLEGLGAVCHVPGPCPGLDNAMCVPETASRAVCRCSPGFKQFGTKLCIRIVGTASEGDTPETINRPSRWSLYNIASCLQPL